MDVLQATCVISGGGPAGMMLGLLLARNGVDVVVIEKHADFFRDFRGDTIHPSTLGVLGELGLRERFLGLPHTNVRTLDAVVSGTRLHPVDFSRLAPPDDFLVLAPQWDFLSFLADEAAERPGFRLLMETTATGLTWRDGAVTGITARGPAGDLAIAAPLVVAADGRDSVLREDAGLRPQRFGVPIDVLWFRLPKAAATPPSTLAYLRHGSMVITIDRGDYFQTGLVIAKGGIDDLNAAGIGAFRDAVAAAAPFLRDALLSIDGWEQVKLLSVQIDRLARWYRRGFLAIGDAAHAMSPAFGVGVNYAVQDAVAAANALVDPLRAIQGGASEEVDLRVLDGLQRRRLPPVAAMQRIQLAAHRGIARPNGPGALPDPLPLLVRGALAAATPLLQRATARFIGRGLRPESVRPGLR
ncbi:monooxygenase [Leifsonia sp. LS1]|uniref:FAD-dependent oxidoreductase n=1 Tax=Leifsonia sp. LS1 TaxID=2828483 RepID=UPI001CFC9F6D|nr:FAD-dependent oxidoreductase [Leifsonia sp. LS1]GIT81811.1 monooxygenase [Leifsonia sp. LS1]